MVSFSAAKINIGLRIVKKRPDGFHNIETVFYPVSIKDAVEIIADNSFIKGVQFTSSGNVIDCPPQQNICLKAYDLLKKDHPQIGNIKLHLHKHIPSGAGLGGGSSNAVAVLHLLNTIFKLQLGTEALQQYALQLGSDCPFFVEHKPCYATGRGNIFTPVHIDLTACKIVVVNPGIHVSTAWAFAQITPQPPTGIPLINAIDLPVEDWKKHIINDFEEPVTRAHTAIANIKNELYQQGALFAGLSGSGSSVFGIFAKADEPRLKFPPAYKVFSV